VGVGFYLGSAVTTLFVLVSLLLLKRTEKRFFSKRRLKRLLIRAIDQPGLLGVIGIALGDFSINIRKSELGDPEIDEDGGEELINLEFLVEVPLDLNRKELFSSLHSLDGVIEIFWENRQVPRDSMLSKTGKNSID
jgi:uncharacterized membrane protein YhiD involved in acid resistance